MNLIEFTESLLGNQPPSGSPYLQALWFDKKGDWDRSHKLIQDIDDRNAAWIHAYLHRKEGDIDNADYWYQRAGKKRPGNSLEEEWEQLVKAFLT